MSQLALVGSKTVTNLVTSLSSEGRPVTCIIYTIMLPWAADVARHFGIPSVLYWIQPATVFSVYYRYFHGYDSLIQSHKDDPSFPIKLLNLPLLEIRDLPSFFLAPNDSITEGYMEWLDSKPPSSVVYVSFGTLAVLQEKQMEEISKGLELSGRDFLWVVNERGMFVNWCNQMEVLSHPSIGCFVTHCGWNSTVESLVSGVPTVGMPQWTDQATNAKLVEDVWGTGVRARLSDEGVVVVEEIVRCLDAVMGEVGVDVRGKAAEWKKKALEAMGEGGSSYRNMKRFVEDVSREINLHG
ncbi:UDP-glycosyltransferase 75D1 [Acorus gramineus]|uniref:UDP-glycosyltransferase 75D1 n=1 Tax=Acorus gramineus TaxID=55184 RepID=A0AAV9B750_ACOGR|nr:UDP-glycosyltransferase 75D1 [Acorus gramineus]